MVTTACVSLPRHTRHGPSGLGHAQKITCISFPRGLKPALQSQQVLGQSDHPQRLHRRVCRCELVPACRRPPVSFLLSLLVWLIFLSLTLREQMGLLILCAYFQVNQPRVACEYSKDRPLLESPSLGIQQKRKRRANTGRDPRALHMNNC